MACFELFERARRAASALDSIGIRSDDTVALLLRNDYPVFQASYGAMMIGAVPTPVNWHSTPPELRHVLDDSGARVLVVHADLLAGVRDVIAPQVQVLVVPTPPEIAAAYHIAAPLDSVPEGSSAWSDWIARFEPHASHFDTNRGSMIYTSGTTGRPKGVRRPAPSATQAKAVSTLRSLAWGFDDIDPASIVSVMTGPMYHSATSIYGLTIPRLGGKLILQPRFTWPWKPRHLVKARTAKIRGIDRVRHLEERYDLHYVYAMSCWKRTRCCSSRLASPVAILVASRMQASSAPIAPSTQTSATSRSASASICAGSAYRARAAGGGVSPDS